jgi:hypothetical protein
VASPSGRSSPATILSSPSQLQGDLPPPRKLEPHIEDEEDRRERSRLEAALKLMGIDKSSQPVTPPSLVSEMVPRPPLPRKASSNRGTPFSRLSTILGFNSTTPALPPDPNPDPETVQAALNELDQREKRQVALLAKGKAEVGYTSPPKPALQRASTEVGPKAHAAGMTKSDSISTLWSGGSGMGGGTGSRPVSLEVTKMNGV